MLELTRTHEMNAGVALAVWAALLVTGVLLGLRMGFGGWRFACAMGVCGILLAGYLLAAAPRMQERLLARLGTRGGALTVLLPLGAYAMYSLGVAEDWKFALLGAAYVLIPTLLLTAVPAGNRSSLLDYAALLVIGLPVIFRWMYRLFPYPPPLTHTLTILLAVSAGLAAFIFARRLPGIGYAIEWRSGFAKAVGVNLSAFHGDRDSAGRSHRIYSLGAIARAASLGTAHGGGDSVFYGVA